MLCRRDGPQWAARDVAIPRSLLPGVTAPWMPPIKQATAELEQLGLVKPGSVEAGSVVRIPRAFA
jgi:hypothetical protein